MRVLPVLALAWLLPACGGGGGGGGGETLVVTNLLDAGPGSLRAAIQAADDGDTIGFEPGLAGAIVLSTGTLLVEKDVLIEGPGAALLGIEGPSGGRAFSIDMGARVVVRAVSVRNTGPTVGGGFAVLGELTLEDVLVEDCVVDSTGRGGGIHCIGGTVVLRRSLVRDCRAYNGGGVAIDGGTLLMITSALTGNQTTGNSAAGLLLSTSDATLVNSTISGNSTTGTNRPGGGIGLFAEFSGSCTCRLANCTVVNNQATGVGGGISLSHSGTGSMQVELRNSIVAFNAATGGSPDLALSGVGAQVLTDGNNVVGDGTGTGLVNGIQGDQVGTLASPLNPGVLPLTSHNVTIWTHPLLAGSPARDAVPNAACRDFSGAVLTTDQRGQPRPVGPACDAGAHEQAAGP